MLLKAFTYVSTITVVICVLNLLYQGFLALLALIPLRRKARHQQRSRQHRFAVVISAHNEETVIGNLLDTLNDQDYPKENYDVFLIADNCTDATAEIGRSKGANVWKRNDPLRKTKGYALNWFFAAFLPKKRQNYDACIIFDADNLVAPDFLKVMNGQLNDGNPLCVGYRDSKNPDDNWISATSSLFWLFQIRMLHHPRTLLGISSTSVMGTGFMFDFSLIDETGWSTNTLTEDIEFTMQQIARGRRVVLVREARLYDEQPVHFRQMVRQRFRWGVGMVQNMKQMVPVLLRSVRSGNLAALDAIWFFYQIPFYLITAGLGLIRTLIQMPLILDDPLLLRPTVFYGCLSVLLLILIAFFIVLLEKQKLRDYWRGILFFPVATLVWGAVQTAALFRPHTTWDKINHTNTKTLKQMG